MYSRKPLGGRASNGADNVATREHSSEGETVGRFRRAGGGGGGVAAMVWAHRLACGRRVGSRIRRRERAARCATDARESEATELQIERSGVGKPRVAVPPRTRTRTRISGCCCVLIQHGPPRRVCIRLKVEEESKLQVKSKACVRGRYVEGLELSSQRVPLGLVGSRPLSQVPPRGVCGARPPYKLLGTRWVRGTSKF
jgi:hypothetical protein